MFPYFETSMLHYLDGRHIDFILEIEATRSPPVYHDWANERMSGSRSLSIIAAIVVIGAGLAMFALGL